MSGDARSSDVQMPRPTPRPRMTVCPYCGELTSSSERCGACGGRFDPLSRQASQNEMGPWQIRSERMPFGPGCSYQRLCMLLDKGKVTADTILRGPSTHQFWMPARRVPGVAHRLGMCHSCGGPAGASDFSCSRCGAHFGVTSDRQHLGLSPHRLLPGGAGSELVAAALSPAAPAEPSGGFGSSGGEASIDDEAFARSAGGAGRVLDARPRWLRVGIGAAVLLIAGGVLGWWAGVVLEQRTTEPTPERSPEVAQSPMQGAGGAGRQEQPDAGDRPTEPVDATDDGLAREPAAVAKDSAEPEAADPGATARQRAIERLRSFP